jgi:DNA repair protein RecO (recombination protein O)
MEEQRSFRVEAVILKHSDWGESDRMLVIMTRQKGKLRAVAKGARKMRSRKAGHVEPFMHVSLQLARGKGPFIVTDAETIDAYQPLREDLLLTGYASYVVELVDKFSFEEEGENPIVFKLLTDTLTRIAASADPWLDVRFYEVTLLDLMGFRPHLFHCANCHNEIKPEPQFLSPAQGGVLCPSCGSGLPGAWKISVDALKTLRHLQRSTYRTAIRIKPPPQTRKELEVMMHQYFSYLLERKLNTPGFINNVRN